MRSATGKLTFELDATRINEASEDEERLTIRHNTLPIFKHPKSQTSNRIIRSFLQEVLDNLSRRRLVGRRTTRSLMEDVFRVDGED